MTDKKWVLDILQEVVINNEEYNNSEWLAKLLEKLVELDTTDVGLILKDTENDNVVIIQSYDYDEKKKW